MYGRVAALLLIIGLLLPSVGASPSVRLALRRRVSDLGAPVVVLYGGHPPRQHVFPLSVTSVPPAFAPGSVVASLPSDLPGAFPTLALVASHALARGELLADMFPVNVTEVYANELPLLDPRVDVTSRGQDFSLSVDLTAASSRLQFAPGSDAWFQWRTLALTRDHLYLWRADTSAAALAHIVGDRYATVALPCQAWDARGRCMLLNQSLSVGGAQIVLDFDRAMSVMPARWLAAARRQLLTWKLGAAQRALVLADFVVSADDPLEAPGNTTVVLGRLSLQRLFTAVAFDSALNVFAAVLSEPVGDGVRVVLSVLAVVQTVFFARYYVSNLLMRLPATLRAPFAGSGGGYVPAVDGTALVFMVSHTLVAVIGAALGYAYAGGTDGGVDVVTAAGVRNAALGALICTCVEAVLLLVVFPVLGGDRVMRLWALRGQSLGTTSPAPTPSSSSASALAPLLDFCMAGAHGACGGLALVATLSVAATHHIASLLIVTIIGLVLVLPSLVYHAAGLFVAVCATPARLSALQTVAILLFAAAQTALAILAGLGIVEWLLAPFLLTTNILYADDSVRDGAWMLVSMVTLAVLAVVVTETRQVLATIIDGDKKQKT